MATYLAGYGLGAAQRINQQRSWHYFTSTMPTGIGAADAIYRGDTLEDQSANNFDLTLNTGVLRRTVDGRSGLIGLDIDIAENYRTAAGLNSIAALTVELIFRPTLGHTAAQNYYFHEGTNPAVEAGNLTYWMYTAASLNRMTLGNEYGAVPAAESKGTAVGMPYGQTVHYVHTRAVDGVTNKIYLNGVLMDTVVFTNAPTGGGDGLLQFGAAARFVLFGARLKTDAAYTQDQVTESYNSIYHAD